MFQRDKDFLWLADLKQLEEPEREEANWPCIVIPLVNDKIFVCMTFPKLLQKMNLKYKMSHLARKTIKIYFSIKFIEAFNLECV